MEVAAGDARKVRHRLAFGIGTQDFKQSAMLLKIVQSLLDARLFRVSLEIHEEEITPYLFLRRPGLDLREVHVRLFKMHQNVMQGPDPVLDRENDGGPILAGRLAILARDHDEARG